MKDTSYDPGSDDLYDIWFVDGTFRSWPADMTTITNGGALLLFSDATGSDRKVLVEAYASHQWAHMVRVDSARAEARGF